MRRSRIQARHLYISARKRGSLGHAGKLTYPTKPLNVESLHRSIRTHKEQGNHPARVIVDIQFPCDRMPPAGSMRGGKSSHARNRVGSTQGAICQFTSGIFPILDARRLGNGSFSLQRRNNTTCNTCCSVLDRVNNIPQAHVQPVSAPASTRPTGLLLVQYLLNQTLLQSLRQNLAHQVG